MLFTRRRESLRRLLFAIMQDIYRRSVILCEECRTTAKTMLLCKLFSYISKHQNFICGFCKKFLFCNLSCIFKRLTYVENCVESVYNFLKTHLRLPIYVKHNFQNRPAKKSVTAGFLLLAFPATALKSMQAGLQYTNSNHDYELTKMMLCAKISGLMLL